MILILYFLVCGGLCDCLVYSFFYIDDVLESFETVTTTIPNSITKRNTSLLKLKRVRTHWEQLF